MSQPAVIPDLLLTRVREIISDQFKIGIAEIIEIGTEGRFINGSLRLDSLDALELAMRVEEEFGVTIDCHEDFNRVFASIGNLTDFIRTRLRSDAVSPWSPGSDEGADFTGVPFRVTQ